MLRNRVYYTVKPFIPSSLRAAIRRRMALRLRESVANIWPIMPGSERPPENWSGWPGGKKFALVLTHDVESAAGLPRCRGLMEIESQLGFRSSFNFVPEGDYRVPEALRAELTKNGFEVGIHDLKHDGRLYQSPTEFSRRAARINRYLSDWQAVGFRSAFMLRKLDWLHELNIQYDASTFDTDPFEPQPEGYHTIFPVWIPNDNSSAPRSERAPLKSDSSAAGGYVELPYTLPQDSTLFLMLRMQTADIWFRKLDWIAEHGGMALVITHPDYMSMNSSTREAGEYPVELYKQFLEYIEEKYSGLYWLALPREIAAYTRQAVVERGARLNGAQPEQLRNGSDARVNGQDTEKRFDQANKRWRLRGKRAAVLLFSYYPTDPRPRRAAEALVKEGVTIDLICLRRNDEEPRREIINGVNVLRLPLRRRRGGKMTYIGQYSAFILRSFLRLTLSSFIRRYDFVHVHNMPDFLVFSALVPKLLGAKIVLDLHDPVPELMQTIFELPPQSFSVRLLKELEKWSIAFADLVLTVNQACKKIYTSRSCPPDKIDVVLNSPEDDVFQFKRGTEVSNGEQRSKPFVILYHGSLVPRNGFDLAVDALETASNSVPTARLMVCGERSPFFDGVMNSVQKRGLQDRVEYLGARNRRQIVAAIDSCDLGIIPNHRNTFTEINTPTRIFEYLALGKPVIAPRTQGIRDYFDDGELIFFEVGDANDLARKIEFAFTNPAEVRQIIDKGQQVYLAHNWSREKSKLLNSIAEIL